MNVKRYENSPAFGAKITKIDYRGLRKIGSSAIQAVEEAIPGLINIGDDSVHFSIATSRLSDNERRILIKCHKHLMPQLPKPKNALAKFLRFIQAKLLTKISYADHTIPKEKPLEKAVIVAAGRSASYHATFESPAAIKFFDAEDRKRALKYALDKKKNIS